MRVTYLSLAVWDLTEIRAYITDHDPNAAQHVGRRLADLINRLSKMPSLGKPGRVFGTRGDCISIWVNPRLATHPKLA